jgi:hypothetical protein
MRIYVGLLNLAGIYQLKISTQDIKVYWMVSGLLKKKWDSILLNLSVSPF